VLKAHLSGRYELVTHGRRSTSTADHVGDISDLAFVETMVRETAPAAIVHLAAAATVESEWRDVLQANIGGTYNVYEAARRAGVDLVVFASSNHAVGGFELEGAPALYREDDPRVYRDTDPPWPDSLYGASKVFGEALGRTYADRYGVRVICLRIGSVLREDDPVEAVGQGAGGWLRLSRDEMLMRYRATWLSQRDCAQLVACALESPVRWAVAFGTSDNVRKIWDLTSAIELLGYRPQDTA
jgi:nucleoside-diphosphate-sugar epimerase